MPGTKVLVRDLKQSTTMRSGRMDEDLVVFADDERNFEILGGRVDKLKEKFEKTMRMKAASRFADDGFSLGDVCEAPKFQPFDDEAWKRLEKERKVKEEEERKEKEEAERKEKMERRERERAARKELAREQRQQLAGESLEDYDYNDGDEKEDEMEPTRAKPKLPPKKKGAAAVAPATPSSPSVAASNQRKQQHRSKPTLPGNKRGATNKEENSDVLLETQKRQEQQRHEQQAKKERSKILEKLTRPPPRRVLDDASRDGGRGVGRGVFGIGRRGFYRRGRRRDFRKAGQIGRRRRRRGGSAARDAPRPGRGAACFGREVRGPGLRGGAGAGGRGASCGRWLISICSSRNLTENPSGSG